MVEFNKMGWWIWLAMAIFLGYGLFQGAAGFQLAIILGAFQCVLYLGLKKSPAVFPVQVRLGFLAILIVGQWPPLSFIYWLPFAGTWAYVVSGYCLLARLMMLAPWNRDEPFTVELVKTTIFSKPVQGSILKAAPAAA